VAVKIGEAKEQTKHAPLAQSTDLSPKVDQDTRNLVLGYAPLVLGADLQADRWGPTRRHGTGLSVGSPAVVDDPGFAQEQCHWVHARSEVGQLAKGASDGQRVEAESGRPGKRRELQLAQPPASAGEAGSERRQGFVPLEVQ
jgi:hypothetical protein